MKSGRNQDEIGTKSGVIFRSSMKWLFLISWRKTTTTNSGLGRSAFFLTDSSSIYIFQIVSWLYFAVQFWCMDGWNEIRELEGNVLSAGCCLPHPRHAEYYNVDRVDIYGCCFISNFAILAAATLLSSIWNSPLTISMTQDNRWIAKVVNLESKIVSELHK